MSFTLTATFDTVEQLQAFLNRGALTTATEVVVVAPKSEKTKAAKQEPAASPSTAKIAAAPEKKDDDSGEKTLDYEKDVKPKFLELFKAKGRDVCVGLLPTFGCKSNISETAPDRLPELLAAIDKLRTA